MPIFNPFLHQEFSEKLIGGKAKNLALLSQSFPRIPVWFCITTEAFQSVTKQFSGHEGELASLIKATPLTGELQSAIEQTVTGLNLKEKFLAVRSSAVGEDGHILSFAGQFDSYLYVTYQELGETIKKVWASAYSERFTAYRRNNRLTGNPEVAVIIQEMVEAEHGRGSFRNQPGDRKPESGGHFRSLRPGGRTGLRDAAGGRILRSAGDGLNKWWFLKSKWWFLTGRRDTGQN